MDKSKVKQKDKSQDKLSWDTAIEDAEELIRAANLQIAGLRDSIRVFKARRAAGEPFPLRVAATPK